MLKKPDRLRTTPLNLDFLNVEKTLLASTVFTDYLQAPNTQSVKLSDCQVVLDDAFFSKTLLQSLRCWRVTRAKLTVLLHRY